MTTHFRVQLKHVALVLCCSGAGDKSPFILRVLMFMLMESKLDASSGCIRASSPIFRGVISALNPPLAACVQFVLHLKFVAYFTSHAKVLHEWQI